MRDIALDIRLELIRIQPKLTVQQAMHLIQERFLGAFRKSLVTMQRVV